MGGAIPPLGGTIIATLESIETQISSFQSGALARFNALDDKIDALGEQITALQNTLNTGLYLHFGCPLCQGAGELTNPVDGVPGPPYTCPQCKGDGTVARGNIDTTPDTISYK